MGTLDVQNSRINLYVFIHVCICYVICDNAAWVYGQNIMLWVKMIIPARFSGVWGFHLDRNHIYLSNFPRIPEYDGEVIQ